MSRQYIRSSNEAPRLGLGTIAFWFLAIDYWNWPDWAYGIWGVLSLFMVFAFFYRTFDETAVDLVRRD